MGLIASILLTRCSKSRRYALAAVEAEESDAGFNSFKNPTTTMMMRMHEAGGRWQVADGRWRGGREW
jgi:hypothetical protein